MQQIILLSFADRRYKNSLCRLRKNTENFPFTKKVLATENDLPKEFLKKLKFRLHRRGFGYWKWKPYLVLKELSELNDGDIIFYSDAGCFWNIEGIDRFNDYLNLLNSHDSGILVFEHPYLEKEWSKGDLLEYLDCYNNNSILMSLQYASGIFAIKKCKNSQELVQEWYDLYVSHYDLCTDKKSKVKNLLGFIENRHDQSTLSLLVKKRPHISISWKEIETLDNIYGDQMKKYPIQCRRLLVKDKPISKIIGRKLSWIYRRLIGLYLIYFEDMHFKNPPAF